MPKEIKIVGVLTSGGDAPGMNAAVRAVVRACEYNEIDCYGIYQGYHGLVNENITKMSARSVKNIINKGGTILKSARCEEFRSKEGREKAFATIKKNNIDALIVIAGKTSSIIKVTEGEKIGKNVFEYASYIEKNLPEYEVRVTVLGHIQRGGSPSSFDRVLASRMGVYSVDCLIKGISNVMIGIKDDEMVCVEVDKAIKSRGEISKNLIRVFDIISI